MQKQIQGYLASQPEPKRADIETLHRRTLKLMPRSKLWCLDGKDANGKTVTHPNIGYGLRTIDYASGKSREFCQIGLCANTTGISVYVLAIADKKHLSQAYGKWIGKPSVTGDLHQVQGAEGHQCRCPRSGDPGRARG